MKLLKVKIFVSMATLWGLVGGIEIPSKPIQTPATQTEGLPSSQPQQPDRTIAEVASINGANPFKQRIAVGGSSTGLPEDVATRTAEVIPSRQEVPELTLPTTRPSFRAKCFGISRASHRYFFVKDLRQVISNLQNLTRLPTAGDEEYSNAKVYGIAINFRGCFQAIHDRSARVFIKVCLPRGLGVQMYKSLSTYAPPVPIANITERLGILADDLERPNESGICEWTNEFRSKVDQFDVEDFRSNEYTDWKVGDTPRWVLDIAGDEDDNPAKTSPWGVLNFNASAFVAVNSSFVLNTMDYEGRLANELGEMCDGGSREYPQGFVQVIEQIHWLAEDILDNTAASILQKTTGLRDEICYLQFCGGRSSMKAKLCGYPSFKDAGVYWSLQSPLFYPYPVRVDVVSLLEQFYTTLRRQISRGVDENRGDPIASQVRSMRCAWEENNTISGTGVQSDLQGIVYINALHPNNSIPWRLELSSKMCSRLEGKCTSQPSSVNGDGASLTDIDRARFDLSSREPDVSIPGITDGLCEENYCGMGNSVQISVCDRSDSAPGRIRTKLVEQKIFEAATRLSNAFKGGPAQEFECIYENSTSKPGPAEKFDNQFPVLGSSDQRYSGTIWRSKIENFTVAEPEWRLRIRNSPQQCSL
ncbi:hypothetical protein H072_5675 [Dactylellina haptotyla CBS 200.50]|uniref:Uncharacterized protein n=1 Tax=Dactylellina haptotyla (strain CBS 200.50) TaxID=1284197 RepID=S8BM09_DACHA|nr:hypothetical protein H072_5675 [Dactylellina haptotyla CBS 200.50]